MRYNLKEAMKGTYLDTEDERVGGIIERMVLDRLENGMEGLLNSDNQEAFQFTISPTPDTKLFPFSLSPGMVISIVKQVDFENVENYFFMLSDRMRTIEGSHIPDTLLAVVSYQNHSVSRRGNFFTVVTWNMQDVDEYAVELQRASAPRDGVPKWLASGMNKFLRRRMGEDYFTY